MKRKLVLTLLALGTIAGYASAFASHARYHRAHHSAFKAHVADICVAAAARHAGDAAREHEQ